MSGAVIDDTSLASGIAAFETKSFSTASRLLSPLAESGNPDAQFRMAIMCQNGLGMVKSDQNAADYMRKAAEQGHALAQHGLGFMYMEGECVE
ncbi:MAG: sel1 repeat family protein, partial [Gammaproteobacteria bacterium]|nr:sel1 repeat family protein [Gammaproteobacteria bacterium]